MAENTMEKTESKNFIEEIIEEDLRSGKCESVITRFPPEPNGYLHIGHAKAICLNFGLAEKYQGRCNLRYDDTNPVKEDEEYVKSIEQDIKWLGFTWSEKLYASDYFPYMYEKAVLLIKKGLAYVCDLSADQIREYRGTLTTPGKESPYRDRSVEENLALFEQMKQGVFADGSKVLRAKIDMASPNLNMRDPVLYRILHENHHRTGDAWCIYPMYDFAHPLEDAVEGITHSICTLEFEAHRPLYDWVIEHCECEKVPHQYEFARLGLTNTVMSKRFLKRLVDEKIVDGWDDPRMPTISGVRRRGFTPKAIRDFCERIGVAKANSEVDYKLLEHCVREDLNETAPRLMAVLEPLKLTIENYPEGKTEVLTAQDLPDGEETHEMLFGRHLYIEQQDFMEVAPNKKFFRLAVGKEVRLKNAYIIKCERVIKDDQGNVVEVICTYDPDSKSGGPTAGRKVKGTLHFVEASSAVPIVVNQYEPLILDQQEDGPEDFMERINYDSKKVLRQALIEAYGKNAQPGQQFQFLRQGYYCRDNKDSDQGNMVFHEIVGLKDSFKKTLEK